MSVLELFLQYAGEAVHGHGRWQLKGLFLQHVISEWLCSSRRRIYFRDQSSGYLHSRSLSPGLRGHQRYCRPL
jgi:hypothetical protein